MKVINYKILNFKLNWITWFTGKMEWRDASKLWRHEQEIGGGRAI